MIQPKVLITIMGSDMRATISMLFAVKIIINREVVISRKWCKTDIVITAH